MKGSKLQRPAPHCVPEPCPLVWRQQPSRGAPPGQTGRTAVQGRPRLIGGTGPADPETEGGQSCAKVWTLGDPWKYRSQKMGPRKTPGRDPLAKPESRAPTSVSPLLPGWDQAGPQGPTWLPVSSRAPAGP